MCTPRERTQRLRPLRQRPLAPPFSKPIRNVAVEAVRAGLLWFLLLTSAGVLLTAAVKGLGLVFLYAGLLVLIVGAYRYGLRTGHFLISPRYSILSILVLAGLVLTALVAAIEVLIQRGW
jgi:hypothetical protein